MATQQVVRVTKVFVDGNKVSKKGKPYTKYTGLDAGGNRYETINDALGNKLKESEGQTVTLEFDEGEFNGKPQLTLTGIEEVGAEFSEATQDALRESYTGTKHSGETQEEKQLRIMRQSALERAINAVTLLGIEVSGVDDLYDIADQFIDYFVNGAPVPA